MSDQRLRRLQSLLAGRPLRYYPVTGSTNDDLKGWLREEPELPSGAVVIAEGQRRGRGRFRRPWSNASGSTLAITTLVRTSDPRAIPMAAGLAVRDAVERIITADAHGSMVSLKWPNDVLIGEKKVSGILVESARHARDAYLLGIGINVAGEFDGSDFASRATSIGSHVSVEIDSVTLAVAVITGLERWLGDPDLFSRWRESLSTLGLEVAVHAPNEVVEGRAVDVDEEGRLILRTESAREERFAAGDVSVRRSAG